MPPKKASVPKQRCQCSTKSNSRCRRKVSEAGKRFCKQHAQCKKISTVDAEDPEQCHCWTAQNDRCSRKVSGPGAKYCKQHANCKRTSERDLHAEVAKAASRIRSKQEKAKPKLPATEAKRAPSPKAAPKLSPPASPKPVTLQAKTSPSKKAPSAGIPSGVSKKAQAFGGSAVSDALATFLRKAKR